MLEAESSDGKLLVCPWRADDWYILDPMPHALRAELRTAAVSDEGRARADLDTVYTIRCVISQCVLDQEAVSESAASRPTVRTSRPEHALRSCYSKCARCDRR
jgi:hypothetical protein